METHIKALATGIEKQKERIEGGDLYKKFNVVIKEASRGTPISSEYNWVKEYIEGRSY